MFRKRESEQKEKEFRLKSFEPDFESKETSLKDAFDDKPAESSAVREPNRD